MIRALFIVIVMAVTGCKQSEPNSAKQIFETRLRENGVAFEIDKNGLYTIRLGGNTLSVSLENVSKDFKRDGDPESVRRFADRVTAGYVLPAPDWESVQPYVRFQLEPDGYADGFDGTLHSRVDKNLVKVFVYTPKDGSSITWISDAAVKDWGVTAAQVMDAAEKNMRHIASQSKIELKEIGGVTLGMISTEESPFKASILLADNFRDLVEPHLGFPVYAVAPCRDFVFLIPRKNKDALGRLGGIVRKEYEGSGHSVTMEILEITEDGLSAIATFAPKAAESDGAGNSHRTDQ